MHLCTGCRPAAAPGAAVRAHAGSAGWCRGYGRCAAAPGSPDADESIKPTPLKSNTRVCGVRLTSASSSWMRRLWAASWSTSPERYAYRTSPAALKRTAPLPCPSPLFIKKKSRTHSLSVRDLLHDFLGKCVAQLFSSRAAASSAAASLPQTSRPRRVLAWASSTASARGRAELGVKVELCLLGQALVRASSPPVGVTR